MAEASAAVPGTRWPGTTSSGSRAVTSSSRSIQAARNDDDVTPFGLFVEAHSRIKPLVNAVATSDTA